MSSITALVAMCRNYIVVIIGALVGAVAGYIYYAEVGCMTGSCAITSDPFISTAYGAVLGGLVVASFKPKARVRIKDDSKK